MLTVEVPCCDHSSEEEGEAADLEEVGSITPSMMALFDWLVCNPCFVSGFGFDDVLIDVVQESVDFSGFG